MTGALLLAAALAKPASPGGGSGFTSARLARIDAAVEEAIGRAELPGAVVLVGRGDRVVFRRAWGSRAVEPQREAMTADTIFDIASLTKVVATAPAILMLIEEGKVRLADPVVRYLPDFAPEGGERAKVTVEELLVHRAGFPPDDPLELYTGTPEEIFARKFRQPLARPPGTAFVYSDVGYEVLGELVRRVSGQTLDAFARDRIFAPLGMRETTFLPLANGFPAARIAPTERRDNPERWMRGEVHDPRAFALGGVAGHAGVFSTADDLARFCRMILAGGRLGGARVLSPLGVDSLTRPRYFGDADVRALGFDVDTAYSKNRGDLFPPGSFGHTGFTGTSLWIDPSSDAYVVFLSNRVHPDGKGDVGRLRGVVASVVAASLEPDTRAAAQRLEARVPHAREVLSGLDVLTAEGFAPIAGKRVGLVTNATGRARDGRSTGEVLTSPEAKKAGVTLVRLFSPEHGLASAADGEVADATDPATGLPVVSLYGARRRPRTEDFDGLDAVVFDVQDAGARFYTYLTTLGYVLEEAARAGRSVVVLDRPNPIGGAESAGPLADADRLSFTAYHAIPVRTGMTIGELARLFNSERGVGAELTVVPMRGWTRGLWYDETGLEWIAPSPNLRSLAAATLYPGIALLETTNLSVGRGTDAPFEQVGAPWLDGARLARVLASRGLPGVRFTPVRFAPAAAPFSGETCGGVRFTVTDRERLRPVALGLEVAVALRDLYAGTWDRSRLDVLLVNRRAFALFDAGEPADRIEASWKEELEAFRRRAAPYLLYGAVTPR
ncbi:MAG TPA: serine hydrolase [Thermoanaerobaculia bacterium]